MLFLKALKWLLVLGRLLGSENQALLWMSLLHKQKHLQVVLPPSWPMSINCLPLFGIDAIVDLVLGLFTSANILQPCVCPFDFLASYFLYLLPSLLKMFIAKSSCCWFFSNYSITYVFKYVTVFLFWLPTLPLSTSNKRALLYYKILERSILSNIKPYS